MANFNMQPHGDLVSLMEDCTEGFEIARNTKTEVGLDAWRRLNHKCDPRKPLRNIQLLRGCSRHRMLAVQTWLQAWRDSSKSCEWFARDLTTMCRTSGNRQVEETLWNGKECAETRVIKFESGGEKTVGQEFFPCLENPTCVACKATRRRSTEEEEIKQQQRMTVMKDLTNKIRSKGRMDAKNRWWVAELLAKDCEKAWTHTGWEDTMQK